MPASLADLGTTQRWLQSVILAPGTNEEAIRWPGAAQEIPPERVAGQTVLPSRTLDPLERIGVYRNMYEARLREALAVDYPLLAGFLGEELWEEFTDLYLQAHPSRSYTLNRLGDQLPDFVAEVDGLPRAAFAGDLARYELAVTEVFDERETPAISVDDIWAVPSEAWETARLAPVAAFRLLELRYPVQDYEAGDRAPRRKDTRLVVFRRDYRPLSLELTKPAFRILEAFADGKILGQALQGARAPKKSLFEWFQRWVSEGLFQRIELGRGNGAENVNAGQLPGGSRGPTAKRQSRLTPARGRADAGRRGG